MFTCPVCFYDQLEEPPRDYNICECCGTEFGNDDEFKSWEDLRREWLQAGAQWFCGTQPFLWNPYMQLFRANVADALPYYTATPFVGHAGVRQSLKEAADILTILDKAPGLHTSAA
jgi:hypothetical protein